MTTIFVVEDHQTFASSLARLLGTRGLYNVRTSGTAEEALVQLQQAPADLVLIDLSLPNRSGLWLVDALKQVRPELPSMILSGHAKKEYVRQALEAGARGYLLKEDIPGILEGIRTVMGGGTYISEALRGE